MEHSESKELMISIIVPVYRSAVILPKLVQEIRGACVNAGWAESFELILVCDASPDESWSVIEQISKESPFVKGVLLRRNFGQHNAIMAGLSQSQGAYVVLMDDDMQHPPSEIPRLVQALQDGADVCYTKYSNRQHVAWKKMGSQFNNWVASWLLSKPSELYLSSFKAMKHEVALEVVKYSGPYAYIDGLILDVTRNIVSIEIEHQARLSGEGGYNIFSSISLWLKMATGFSIVPLRLASLLGLLITFVSFISLIYVVIARIYNPSLSAGWPSVIATVLILGGVQLACIGIIGEYIGRTYLLVNKKPQYVIRSKTNLDEIEAERK